MVQLEPRVLSVLVFEHLIIVFAVHGKLEPVELQVEKVAVPFLELAEARGQQVLLFALQVAEEVEEVEAHGELVVNCELRVVEEVTALEKQVPTSLPSAAAAPVLAEEEEEPPSEAPHRAVQLAASISVHAAAQISAAQEGPVKAQSNRLFTTH